MRTIKSILKHSLIALIYGLMCIFSWELVRHCGVDREAHDKLPTIEEIQKQIGATPDGKLGKETEKLWNLAICNQSAKRYFKND